MTSYWKSVPQIENSRKNEVENHIDSFCEVAPFFFLQNQFSHWQRRHYCVAPREKVTNKYYTVFEKSKVSHWFRRFFLTQFIRTGGWFFALNLRTHLRISRLVFQGKISRIRHFYHCFFWKVIKSKFFSQIIDTLLKWYLQFGIKNLSLVFFYTFL